MKKIKWSVIGAGGIADRRAIPGLLLDPQNELVAVMDMRPEEAKRVAEKYNVPAYFSDAEEMLKTVECDAVYIATPVFCHYEQAMLALNCGVHVFMEKPITLNAADGEKLIAAFKEKGLQLTIGYMMGYHNLHQKARRLVQGGGLGKLNLARMQFSCWYPDIPGAWRQKKALGGGGCIMDLAVHCMELYSAITGEEIAEVKSFYATKTFNYEVEDSAVIAFRSESGVMGHIDVNFNIPDACSIAKLELYGTDGCIYAENTLSQVEAGKLKYTYAPQGGYDAAQDHAAAKAQTFYGKGGNMYTKQFKAFNKLLGGTPDYTNAERAVRIQKLCDEIYQ
ncbi:MAG: Gfo/Idh/MocA family oxidoreductase [Clostridia bacterium]|nr:Gfo/Idh/MocA family oxidoreductase [Clostridia bacterium]